MQELILLITFVTSTVFCPEYPHRHMQADSLKIMLENTSDSSRIPVLLSLSWELRNKSPEKSVAYGIEAIDLATKYNDFNNLAKAYSFVGVAYKIMGRYSESIDYYYKGHEIAEKYGIKDQGGYAHLNLANLYLYQEHGNLAVDNIKQAEVIANETGNKSMLAYAHLYYGRAFKLEDKLDSALIEYKQSLTLRQELEQIAEQATCYKDIGDVYYERGQYSAALKNYNESLTKLDKQNDKDLYANVLLKKSTILLEQNNLPEASTLAHQGLSLALEIGADMAIRDALRLLASISAKELDYKSAYDYQQKVIQYNDTLFSQKLSEKIFSMEYQMEKQQKEIKIDLLNKDNAIKQLEINRIRTLSLAQAIILVLMLALLGVVLILFSHRRKKTKLLEKQNIEIIKQQESIEEQNVQLKDANDRLERSEDDLRKMVQTKDKLFSIIAHDLRNPFMALEGLTEVMKLNAASLKPEEITEYAGIIQESSQKLLNLIENLLQWANSQTGSLKLVPRILSLKNVSDEVLKILKTQSEAKGITLENNINEKISVYADYDCLAVIFRNLVSNGIKYTEKGGRVSLNATIQDNVATIEVSDTGIGIDQKTIDKLFKIEESFSTTGTNHEAGTGLGLIICKEFVQKNGGNIFVESKPGEGAIFRFTLPLTRPQ